MIPGGRACLSRVALVDDPGFITGAAVNPGRVLVDTQFTLDAHSVHGPVWLDLSGLCACPEDRVFDPADPNVVATAPWYNPVVPWSVSEFIGVVPVDMRVDGGVVSRGGSDVSPGVGVAARTRVEFEFLLVATSPRGLRFGSAWFAEQCTTRCCRETNLWVTSWCDPEWTPIDPYDSSGWWVVPGVTLVDMDWVAPEDNGWAERFCMRRVVVAYETGVPCTTTRFPLATYTVAGPWDTPVECWKCPDCTEPYDCVACDALVPEYNNLVGGSPGFVQPLELVRNTFPLVVLPGPWGALPALTTHLYNQSGSPVQNITVKIVPSHPTGADPADNWGLYECVTPYKQAHICEIPPQSEYVLDDRNRKAGTRRLVAPYEECGAAGWEWTQSECGETWEYQTDEVPVWWLVIETNPHTTPTTGFSVTVDVYGQNCGAL